MPQQSRVRTFSFAVLALAACGKDKLQGPEAEVKKSDVKVDLPAVPAFDLPPAPGDGSHSVKELRVKGKKYLATADGTEVTVHGYITWAYDCMTAVRKPDESEKDVQKRIDEDPTLCERPKFYIGDDKATPIEKSLWVVDVPRPYNKLEMERMKKQDRTDPLKCEPNEKDPKKNVCPPYQVGDEVSITGTFKTSSPHSERNSEGLLVYKKMKNVTQNWESPDVVPPPGSPTTPPSGGPPPPGGKLSPEDLVKGKKGH
jgi:hypothetical protein